MLRYSPSIFVRCASISLAPEINAAIDALNVQFNMYATEDAEARAPARRVEKDKNRSTSGLSKNSSAAKWNAVPTFKATNINTGEGAEKHLNDIRTTLNKISIKNYPEMSTAILEAISKLIAENDVDILSRAAHFIFDISSANAFFSKLYADLYVELMSMCNVFTKLLADFVIAYCDQSGFPVYVNPDTDYDLYCKYTKSCDKRKAHAAFISHMANLGAVSIATFGDIVVKLCGRAHIATADASRIADVEEIADVIFIFATTSTVKFQGEAETELIDIAEMKVKEHPGLSSRALFKFKDIVSIKCV